MKKKERKKLTKADLEPSNFNSQEENEAALEKYRNQNIYFQFFFGDGKIFKNNQEGKPTPPY